MSLLPPSGDKLEITLSWATIFKVFLALLLAFSAIKLAMLGALLCLSLLIAITLFPLIQWTRKRGWAGWTGIALCASLMLVCVGGFVGILVPTVSQQGALLVQNFPDFEKKVMAQLPQQGFAGDTIHKLFDSAASSDPGPMLGKFVSLTGDALEAVGGFLVIMVISIYLLADGERVFQWLIAFLPKKHRGKVAEASPEISRVVSSYMIGQGVTSMICGAYVFTVLLILKVPNAALLAVIAAVFDVLPLVGFFLSTIPALLIALTVSPLTAGLVLLLYIAYHLAETYFIVPKIYGHRLRLSTLTVLVACMAAGILAGVLGVIMILPVIACYPTIERLWLKPRLEEDTVARHQAIDAKFEEAKI